MQRETAEARASKWFAKLQHALEGGERTQRDLEARLTKLHGQRTDGSASAEGGGEGVARRLAGGASVGASASGGAPAASAGTTEFMPDVLAMRAVFHAQVAKLTDRAGRLEAECDAWRRLREGGGSVGERPPATGTAELAYAKECALDQVVTLQSAYNQLLAARATASVWPYAPAMEGARTALSAAQALELLHGGKSAVEQSVEFGMPGTLAQAELFGATATAIEEAIASDDARELELGEARKQLGAADGDNAVVRELYRLFESLESRVERVKLASAEYEHCGASIQLKRLLQSMPIGDELSPNLPPLPAVSAAATAPSAAALSSQQSGGVVPAAGSSSPALDPMEWGEWLVRAADEHSAAAARLRRGETAREALASSELTAVNEQLSRAQAQLREADELVRSWLRAEGAKRVYASAQGKERRRLRREMLARRCAVFRRMFSQPTVSRVQAKRAALELRLANAASELAQQVLTDPVQTRQYTEGTARVTVLESNAAPLLAMRMPDDDDGACDDGGGAPDGRQPPSASAMDAAEAAAAAQAAADARAVLLRSLHLAIGARQGDRLYVQAVRRTHVPYHGEFGAEVKEAAILLVIGVRDLHRELPREQHSTVKSPVDVLNQLQELHGSGCACVARERPGWPLGYGRAPPACPRAPCGDPHGCTLSAPGSRAQQLRQAAAPSSHAQQLRPAPASFLPHQLV